MTCPATPSPVVADECWLALPLLSPTCVFVTVATAKAVGVASQATKHPRAVAVFVRSLMLSPVNNVALFVASAAPVFTVVFSDRFVASMLLEPPLVTAPIT
jgi:hypothetical protein